MQLLEERMAGKMTSTGISLDQDEIRVLMRGDRRSLSWLVREAVQMYLGKQTSPGTLSCSKRSNQRKGTRTS
jgi:hypothetical protein